MNRQKTADQARLSAFLAKVMEPLPDEELIDRHYNAQVRQAQLEQWREVAVREHAAHKLLAAATYQEKLDALMRAEGVRLSIPERDICLKVWRKALVDALLTPCSNKSHVAWKRSTERQWDYLPVPRSKIEDAIAADEDFIAAHPTRRRRTAR